MQPSLEVWKSAPGRCLYGKEALHHLPPYYHKALLAWSERFRQVWPKLATTCGEHFKRMWKYYLLSCAGVFRARSIQIGQLVMTKQGIHKPAGMHKHKQPAQCVKKAA